MPFVAFKEARIHYQCFGQGRAVVLLHGFLGAIPVWKFIVPELAKRYKVVLIDLPGHGKSDSFGYIHKMDVMGEAVKAVLNYLNLRKYVLMGHSMGGYVSLAFAEKYMDNLRGLVLLHSTAHADSEEKKSDRSKAIKIAKRNKERYVNESMKKLFFKTTIKQHPELLEKAKQIAENTSTQGIVAALEGMKIRKNTEVVLQFCTCPVLFIAGLHDKIIPLEQHQHQFLLPAQNKTVLLEHSAHMGFYEEPQALLDGLLPFLRTCFGPL